MKSTMPIHLDVVNFSSSLYNLNIITGSAERPLATLTGHSGPVVGVLLCLPLALSAAGCTVRLWDVSRGGGGGACLKLLQHGDSPVTAMTWSQLYLRSFNLQLLIARPFCKYLIINKTV